MCILNKADKLENEFTTCRLHFTIHNINVVSRGQTAFFPFLSDDGRWKKRVWCNSDGRLVLATIQFLEMLIGGDGKESINKVRMTSHIVRHIVSSFSRTCSFAAVKDVVSCGQTAFFPF